jgi:hypothetical protein
VDIKEVQRPDWRVVVFHIPSRPIRHAYHLDGKYYMRSGESLVAMTPDQLRQVFNERGPVRPVVTVSAILVVLVLSIVVSSRLGIGAQRTSLRRLRRIPIDRQGVQRPLSRKVPRPPAVWIGATNGIGEKTCE